MKIIKSRKKSGFTLIEMVVVIAIVVIIAAIAIPQALKAINKSKASTDIANARTYAGQIMTRIANNEVTVGAGKNLVSGTSKQITGDDATTLIGGNPAAVKLVTGQSWFATYTTDTNGNDSIKISIGDTTSAVEVYPEIKGEWAKYVKQ